MGVYKLEQRYFARFGNAKLLDENGELLYGVKTTFFKSPKCFTVSKDNQEIFTITKKPFSFGKTFYVESNGEELFTFRRIFTVCGFEYELENTDFSLECDTFQGKFSIFRNRKSICEINRVNGKRKVFYEMEFSDTYDERIIFAVAMIMCFLVEKSNGLIPTILTSLPV